MSIQESIALPLPSKQPWSCTQANTSTLNMELLKAGCSTAFNEATHSSKQYT